MYVCTHPILQALIHELCLANTAIRMNVCSHVCMSVCLRSGFKCETLTKYCMYVTVTLAYSVCPVCMPHVTVTLASTVCHCHPCPVRHCHPCLHSMSPSPLPSQYVVLSCERSVCITTHHHCHASTYVVLPCGRSVCSPPLREKCMYHHPSPLPRLHVCSPPLREKRM